jgi:hypothetical protein
VKLKLILIGALLQLILWTGVHAQAIPKIRIGYPSISSRQAQLWVAKDEGIFRKHGLDVELVFLRGGQTRMEQFQGKRFGISGFGSATHNAALILFKSSTWSPPEMSHSCRPAPVPSD